MVIIVCLSVCQIEHTFDIWYKIKVIDHQKKKTHGQPGMDANMDGIAALGDDSQLVAPEYAEYRNLYHSKWLMEIGLESSVIAVNLLCFVLSLFY